MNIPLIGPPVVILALLLFPARPLNGERFRCVNGSLQVEQLGLDGSQRWVAAKQLRTASNAVTCKEQDDRPFEIGAAAPSMTRGSGNGRPSSTRPVKAGELPPETRVLQLSAAGGVSFVNARSILGPGTGTLCFCGPLRCNLECVRGKTCDECCSQGASALASIQRQSDNRPASTGSIPAANRGSKAIGNK